MTPKELIADSITSSVAILEMTLADFSDADLFKRPVPGANHAAWQLGHLAAGDAYFASALGANVDPPAWPLKFDKSSATLDDPAKFPPKADLIAAIKRARDAAANRVRQMSDADLNQPAPESIRSLCPTLGHLALLFPAHTNMHVGQFQVIRRALNKPVLF